jgi:hypothetical protein
MSVSQPLKHVIVCNPTMKANHAVQSQLAAEFLKVRPLRAAAVDVERQVNLPRQSPHHLERNP